MFTRWLALEEGMTRFVSIALGRAVARGGDRGEAVLVGEPDGRQAAANRELAGRLVAAVASRHGD